MLRVSQRREWTIWPCSSHMLRLLLLLWYWHLHLLCCVPDTAQHNTTFLNSSLQQLVLPPATPSIPLTVVACTYFMILSDFLRIDSFELEKHDQTSLSHSLSLFFSLSFPFSETNVSALPTPILIQSLPHTITSHFCTQTSSVFQIKIVCRR